MLSAISVSKVMTRDVITLDPKDTFDKAEELFQRNNIHHLPVVDGENKVLGMISKSDYLSLSDRFSLFSKSLGDKINKSYFSSLLCEEVMRSPAVCVSQDSSLAVAIGIFQENLFHAIPIIDADKKMVGILSTFDVLNFLNRQLEGQTLINA
ncbi:MAG: CBS domain-containing protein [Saprospiraceae bacterium]|nr:CBS domain-containing protein [Saprospiraceae bacterium]